MSMDHLTMASQRFSNFEASCWNLERGGDGVCVVFNHLNCPAWSIWRHWGLAAAGFCRVVFSTAPQIVTWSGELFPGWVYRP
jgi:hypothetical protein